MKKLSLLLLFVVLFIGCSDDDKATFVVNFEGRLTEANSEYKSAKPFVPGDYERELIKDNNDLLSFEHFFADWGSGYTFSGATFTNKADKTTPGFSNSSAITGKARTGTTYLTISLNTPPQITLLRPNNYSFKGMWITNSTYAYLAIKDGNDGFGSVTKFADGDWFKLTINGYTPENTLLGKVEFYLADFRNGKTEIINDWVWVDFSPIASACILEFEMSSTDNGDWGMNTPAYFCMDDITLEEK